MSRNSETNSTDKELKKFADIDRANAKLLQSVFDTTNHAIVVFQTLYNEDNTIKDFKFLKINEVLRKMYGSIDPLGKSYLKITKYGVKMGLFDAFKKVMTFRGKTQ